MSAEGGGQPTKEYLAETGILRMLPFFPTDRVGERGVLELVMSWPEVAQQYSSRLFSDPTDRFLALQGVQKLYSATNKEKFILGLRSSAFAKDLLWTWELGRMGRCSNFTSNLPTWSWLSYNGEISYGKKSNDDLTESEALSWRTLRFDRSGNVTNLPLIAGKIRTVLLRPKIDRGLSERCWEVDCYSETDFWNEEKQRFEDDPARGYNRATDILPLGKVTLDDLDVSEPTNASKSDGPNYKTEPLKLECLLLGERGPEMISSYT